MNCNIFKSAILLQSAHCKMNGDIGSLHTVIFLALQPPPPLATLKNNIATFLVFPPVRLVQYL